MYKLKCADKKRKVAGNNSRHDKLYIIENMKLEILGISMHSQAAKTVSFRGKT